MKTAEVGEYGSGPGKSIGFSEIFRLAAWLIPGLNIILLAQRIAKINQTKTFIYDPDHPPFKQTYKQKR